MIATVLREKRGASALGSGIEDNADATAAALGIAGNVPIRLAIVAAAGTSATSVTATAEPAAGRSPPAAVTLLVRALERRCGMSVLRAAADSGVAADSGLAADSGVAADAGLAADAGADGTAAAE